MICPFMSRPVLSNSFGGQVQNEVLHVDCKQKQCALWIQIQGNVHGCALNSIAMTLMSLGSK
jgi:hypothetical protein